MFGDSFNLPTCFDFEVLSEYTNILSKLFCLKNDYNNFFPVRSFHLGL